jgi:hypothetical protein
MRVGVRGLLRSCRRCNVVHRAAFSSTSPTGSTKSQQLHAQALSTSAGGWSWSSSGVLAIAFGAAVAGWGIANYVNRDETANNHRSHLNNASQPRYATLSDMEAVSTISVPNCYE